MQKTGNSSNSLFLELLEYAAYHWVRTVYHNIQDIEDYCNFCGVIQDPGPSHTADCLHKKALEYLHEMEDK